LTFKGARGDLLCSLSDLAFIAEEYNALSILEIQNSWEMCREEAKSQRRAVNGIRREPMNMNILAEFRN
jgi:hypothetical protein